jgi:hypothetical protein
MQVISVRVHHRHVVAKNTVEHEPKADRQSDLNVTSGLECVTTCELHNMPMRGPCRGARRRSVHSPLQSNTIQAATQSELALHKLMTCGRTQLTFSAGARDTISQKAEVANTTALTLPPIVRLQITTQGEMPNRNATDWDGNASLIAQRAVGNRPLQAAIRARTRNEPLLGVTLLLPVVLLGESARVRQRMITSRAGMEEAMGGMAQRIGCEGGRASHSNGWLWPCSLARDA